METGSKIERDRGRGRQAEKERATNTQRENVCARETHTYRQTDREVRAGMKQATAAAFPSTRTARPRPGREGSPARVARSGPGRPARGGPRGTAERGGRRPPLPRLVRLGRPRRRGPQWGTRTRPTTGPSGPNGPGRARLGSSVNDELVDRPVLVGPVGQVPADDEGDLALRGRGHMRGAGGGGGGGFIGGEALGLMARIGCRGGMSPAGHGIDIIGRGMRGARRRGRSAGSPRVAP